MFTRGIAVLVAAVVLTGSPALAQSSDLLASAERAALTTVMEQDQSVVRRRRSGGVGAVGAVLVGVGMYLALQPVACSDVIGPKEAYDGASEFVYSTTRLRGECTIKVTETWGVNNRVYHYYELDYTTDLGWAFGNPRPTVTTDKRMNQIGWATAAAGGVLLAWGLRGVDVPVRLDVAPAGGFRISRSFGW